ncbi:Hypothetical protein A7982_01410 [Minicystis rosea]|nr:Hypothetical protein A7982_01410 [Minicystis rosea]
MTRTSGAAALFAALSLLTCTGCTFHRELTPWLRTSRHIPFRILAESGSHGPYDTTRAERKVGDTWVEILDAGDQGFGFAGGTRAVLDGTLYRASGPLRNVLCNEHIGLRASPSGELVCVEIDRRRPSDYSRSPEHLRIVSMDRDGNVRAERHVVLPVVMATKPIEGPDVSTHFLGFVPEGLVFSVFVSRSGESFASEAVKQCTAYVLHPDDRWTQLGTLSFQVIDLWKCRFPRPWNEANGWHIQMGDYPRDSSGEPEP